MYQTDIPSFYTVHSHYRRRQHASHWDLRLLSANRKFTYSWALPLKRFPKKGERLLAIETAHHSIETLDLEGDLEGGDRMEIIETGECTIISLKNTNMVVNFHGKIIKGVFVLVNIKENNWLLIGK